MNDNVDYGIAAELFPGQSQRRRALSYHRFNTLAEALQYAVEQLQPAQLAGAYIEADEERFGAARIRTLYDAASYPLPRRVPAGK